MDYTNVQLLREFVEAVNTCLEKDFCPLVGMRTVTQRESRGDTSIDTVGYYQTLVLEDEILTTQAELNRQAAVPELVEALKKIAKEAGDLGDGAPDAPYLAKEMLILEQIAKAALAKVKTE